MKSFGSRPHPRGLILGFEGELTAQLEPLFATSKVISNLSEVEQTEWDVLVTAHGCDDARVGLYVVAVESDHMAGQSFGRITWQSQSASITYAGESRATEFPLPSGLPAQVATLVEQHLGPRAVSEGSHRVLFFGGTPCRDANPIHPFLLTIDGRIVAGWFERSEHGPPCWCLPSHAMLDAPAWVSAALSVWGKQDAQRFPPSEHDWQHRPEWRLDPEQAAALTIDEIIAERDRVVTDIDARLSQARTNLLNETRIADEGRRVLLTGQGDELCEEVAVALEDLGFQVERMDPVWPAGDKREDLRVRLKAKPDWISLVEVRGHRKGVQLADLIKLHSRFRTRYLQDTKALPSATWLFGNHSIDRDPSVRQVTLQSHQSDVEAFGQDGAMVIDTVQLFKLTRAVANGRLTAAIAQSALIDGTGRFALPEGAV